LLPFPKNYENRNKQYIYNRCVRDPPDCAWGPGIIAEKHHAQAHNGEKRDAQPKIDVAQPMPATKDFVPPERMTFSMKETAEILGVSYATVWRLFQRGLLKSSNALRAKRIPKVRSNSVPEGNDQGRAFSKAGIVDPVQVAGTGEEAIAYLAGTGRYSSKTISKPSFFSPVLLRLH
jgi:hypothetical protein